ncbi:MAG: 4-vinyl reductase [Candidatus Micrarchaeota archaeon]|nr:4-vinyl reductase [Candidatus Micrarchaeota archaeon]
MNFFEMLIMSRKMAFQDGTVTLYGENVLIFPAPSIIKYICLTGTDPKNAKELYHMAKESILERRGNINSTGNSEADVSWVIDTVNLYGLGKLHYQETAGTAPAGIIIVENSPFSNSPDCMVGAPMDHILRGILAGMASAVFNKELEAVETECRVVGSSVCKIALDTKENLMKRYPAMYKAQT